MFFRPFWLDEGRQETANKAVQHALFRYKRQRDNAAKGNTPQHRAVARKATRLLGAYKRAVARYEARFGAFEQGLAYEE